MGLFDYIRCEYPLPDGFDGDLTYQTKDTPAYYMEHYTITAEGKLIHHSVTYETRPKAERPFPDAEEGSWRALAGSVRAVPAGSVEVPFHGALNFYTSNIGASGPHGYATDDDEPGWYRDYVALFDRGQLIKIEGGLTLADMQVPHVSRARWHELHR